jgi:hypothetical protein
MPNPRNTVVFDGQTEGPLTFKADNSTIVYDSTKVGGSVAVGLACTVSADSTVALCQDGDLVLGVVETVEPQGVDAKVTVRVTGAVTLAGGTAATLTLGSKIVGALNGGNRGYIRANNTATAAENAKARGIILDASTASAVKVWLS